MYKAVSCHQINENQQHPATDSDINIVLATSIALISLAPEDEMEVIN